MANMYKKTGDIQGELGAYTQWANNNPQDPTPHFFLAEAYRRQGNYDLQIENYSNLHK
jgi:cytochrome c-type biogenesis protein CcmH/NrfG